jgi:phospholipase/lecithinase/hemolysin
MKKNPILAACVVALFVVSARAGYYEETVNVGTNAAVVTAAFPFAGTLDKVEVVQPTTATNTIVVATYSGTTAVDTLVSLADAFGNKVVRPRIIGTTTAGVALAAAVNGSADYTAGTVLVAPYERPYVAGNVKATITANAANGTATVPVTLRFYYTRD